MFVYILETTKNDIILLQYKMNRKEYSDKTKTKSTFRTLSFKEA